MQGFVNDFKYQWNRAGNSVPRLILINVGIFLFLNITDWFTGGFLTDPNYNRMNLFGMPGNILTYFGRFWTLFTYAFTHLGFMHIFWNMIMLYWFSRVFQEFLGDKKLVPLYLLGGAAGGIAYLLLYNLIPQFSAVNERSYLIGASAAVYAIVVAAATVAPNYKFFLLFLGPVPIKYLALGSVVLSFLALRGSNAGGEMAHLGGALAGYLFVVLLRKGTDLTAPISGSIDWVKGLFGRERNFSVTRNANYRRDTNTSPRRTIHIKPGSSSTKEKELSIDAILDKINEKGYEGLTKKEKEILFRESKKN